MRHNIHPVFRICPIIILLCIQLIAQTDTVTHIRLEGNQKTHDSTILREVCHQIPAPFDTAIAEEDQNRIYNLGIFSTVEITREDSSYIIFVTEGPRWIPFPVIHYNEAKGKDGWSYGLGLALLNFRGINETVHVGFSTGDADNYFLFVQDPWVAGNHISLGLSLFRQTNIDAVYAYRITQQHLSINTGFYIRQLHKFSATGGYEHRDIQGESTNPLFSAILPEKQFDHLFLDFTYEYDTRDIYIDPQRGSQIGFEITQNAGLGKSVHFNSVQFWEKKWILLRHLSSEPVLSFTTVAVIQFSDRLPLFEHLYLGGEDYVRGYSPIPTKNPPKVQNRMENQNIIYQSLAVQQTLFPRTDFNGIELGIDWHVFFDWGFGSDSIKEFRLSRSVYGYGFGFVFFASGFGLVVFDFGFNPYESGPYLHLSDSN